VLSSRATPSASGGATSARPAAGGVVSLAGFERPPAAPRAIQVKARTISQTGAFGAARPLSSEGRVARTDTSPTGRVAVVWQRSSNPYTVKAAFGP
jgi:hypothetical protein